MHGNAEMLDFEEGHLDTGNINYREILGRVGHAVGLSLVCACEVFGWCKSAV